MARSGALEVLGQQSDTTMRVSQLLESLGRLQILVDDEREAGKPVQRINRVSAVYAVALPLSLGSTPALPARPATPHAGS